MLPDSQYRDLLELRVSSPAQFQSRLADRARPSSLLPEDGKLFLIAADHPARGANAVGNDPLAMANRQDLLRRLLITLADPGCDGIMGSPDILEELAVLGALENKVVVGTMNRGGLAGAEWGLDDRHTAYSAQQIAKAKLDGGKMLLRIHDTDPGTKNTLELCARYVSELADQQLMAMVEPLPFGSNDTELLVRCVGVANALGHTSAYTWLKLPATQDVAQVMAATTLPALILGGAPGPDPESAYESWETALAVPNVRGLVVGRTLLYPTDGDVAAAVKTAGEIVHGENHLG